MAKGFMSLTKEDISLLEKLFGANGIRNNIGLIPYLAGETYNRDYIDNLLFDGPNAPLAEYTMLYQWLVYDNERCYLDFEFASLLYILYLKYELTIAEILYIILSQLINYTFRDEDQKDSYYPTIYFGQSGEGSIDEDYTVGECIKIIDTLRDMDFKKHSFINPHEILESCTRKKAAIDNYSSYAEANPASNKAENISKTIDFGAIAESIEVLLQDNLLKDIPLTRLRTSYIG